MFAFGLQTLNVQILSNAQAVEYVFNELNEMKLGRADIEVQYYDNPWRQRSVIARCVRQVLFAELCGSAEGCWVCCRGFDTRCSFVGAVRPDQIVVLGSHTDSIASTIQNAPGGTYTGSERVR